MMNRFKPDQPLEARLNSIRIMEIAMNVGQIIFIIIAMFNYYKPEALVGIKEVSYFFAGIAIFQFFLVKYRLVPKLTREAHENLPS